jgi:uncharacterized protein (TIGR02231 family)
MRTALLLLLALTGLGPAARAQEPTELTSRISEVTVYPSTARIVRAASGLAGDGRYVLRGLPATLDPASVRVRCEGGFVVGVEVRERREDRSPTQRLEALRAERAELRSSIEEEEDELLVLAGEARNLRALRARSGAAERRYLQEGGVDLSGWRERLEFTRTGLRDNARRQRELGWELEALRARLAQLETEERDCLQDQAVRLYDVFVKLAGSAKAERVEVAYLVSGAGWRPRYDLRADAEARSVNLRYRGEVWQRSGEDWQDVALLLSSAEPLRGASGATLESRWAWLHEPGVVSGRASAPASESMDLLERSGYADFEASDDGMAQVLESGLSVRFVVPGTDSVLSGKRSATVAIGEVTLSTRPEYYCVPRSDTTVWLRGYARNEGRWPILPGTAAVYLGEDFQGHAELGQVELDQEFTVPLGAADAISCERVKTRDLAEGPSFFGSRASETESWRLTFTNHSAAIREADGSVKIVVREPIPRATDDEVKVSLNEVSHPLSRDERWKKDAEELGIQTWLLELPAEEPVALRYSIVVSHPKDLDVSYREEVAQ